MFKIETDPRYWWPVVVAIPERDKPGAIAEHKLEAQFKWLSPDAYQAWLDEAHDKNLGDAQCVPQVCTGFRHVLREDGQPLESTAENLALLLGDKQVARAFAKAFIESRAKAAEKN